MKTRFQCPYCEKFLDGPASMCCHEVHGEPIDVCDYCDGEGGGYAEFNHREKGQRLSWFTCDDCNGSGKPC